MSFGDINTLRQWELFSGMNTSSGGQPALGLRQWHPWAWAWGALPRVGWLCTWAWCLVCPAPACSGCWAGNICVHCQGSAEQATGSESTLGYVVFGTWCSLGEGVSVPGCLPPQHLGPGRHSPHVPPEPVISLRWPPPTPSSSLCPHALGQGSHLPEALCWPHPWMGLPSPTPCTRESPEALGPRWVSPCLWRGVEALVGPCLAHLQEQVPGASWCHSRQGDRDRGTHRLGVTQRSFERFMRRWPRQGGG